LGRELKEAEAELAVAGDHVLLFDEFLAVLTGWLQKLTTRRRLLICKGFV
jgi:hypothetical protein